MRKFKVVPIFLKANVKNIYLEFITPPPLSFLIGELIMQNFCLGSEGQLICICSSYRSRNVSMCELFFPSFD
jgi:hypothetical protein